MKTAESNLKSFPVFDIIFLNLELPNENGEQMVKNIQKFCGDLPTIILTSFSDIGLARKILSQGVSDFLIKKDINSETVYKGVIYAIERKGFLRNLQKNREVYQSLFDFSPQPMWIFDPSTLYFLNVNKVAIAKYGYTLKEFKNMTLMDIRGKDQVEFLEKSIQDRKKKDVGKYAGNFYHTIKSGKTICVEIYSNDVDYEGKTLRLVLANDISDKQEYLNTILTHNDKLVNIAWKQSNLIKAPMARLLNLIALLEMEHICKEEITSLLDKIRESGNRLDKIIQAIVEESRTMDT